MTDKPVQHSVTLAHNLRGYMNVQIDELLRTLEDRAGQLEQAFMAELAHLDELFTDADPEDVSQDNLLQVERFDKGYARTLACIQAATERLVEARAHIARITNTIEPNDADRRADALNAERLRVMDKARAAGLTDDEIRMLGDV